MAVKVKEEGNIMNDELICIDNKEIKNLIYTIRGKQVMLDSDVGNCEEKYRAISNRVLFSTE